MAPATFFHMLGAWREEGRLHPLQPLLEDIVVGGTDLQRKWRADLVRHTCTSHMRPSELASITHLHIGSIAWCTKHKVQLVGRLVRHINAHTRGSEALLAIAP